MGLRLAFRNVDRCRRGGVGGGAEAEVTVGRRRRGQVGSGGEVGDRGLQRRTDVFLRDARGTVASRESAGGTVGVL